jgi:hypothetical protein
VPRYLCPLRQVFQPPRFVVAMRTSLWLMDASDGIIRCYPVPAPESHTLACNCLLADPTDQAMFSSVPTFKSVGNREEDHRVTIGQADEWFAEKAGCACGVHSLPALVPRVVAIG